MTRVPECQSRRCAPGRPPAEGARWAPGLIDPKRGRRNRRGGSAAQPRPSAGERSRFVRFHVIANSVKRVKDYAADQGLPVKALYQAAKRLRKRAVLPPSGRRPAKPKRFVRVAAAPASTAGREVAWRVRCPNGTIVESTALLAEVTFSSS